MKDMFIKMGLEAFKMYVIPALKEAAKKTPTKWDDLLLEELGHVIDSEPFLELLKLKV